MASAPSGASSSAGSRSLTPRVQTGLAGSAAGGVPSTVVQVDEDGTMQVLRVGAVAQEAPGTETSLLDTVLEADVERHDLLQALETAEPEDLGDIYARLIDIDADRAPSRAGSVSEPARLAAASGKLTSSETRRPVA